MRIGTTTFHLPFRFSSGEFFQTRITNAGTPTGYWIGQVMPRFQATDADVTKPATIEILLTVNGVAVWRTRYISRGLWRHQIWRQEQVTLTPQTQNFAVRPHVYTPPVGDIIGTFANVWTDPFTTIPIRSYMHAYFRPLELGPQTGVLPFTPSEVPESNPLETYTAHAEPVTFAFTNAPGDAVEFVVSTFKESPNADLDEPINDDPPEGGIGPEPDEIAATVTPAVVLVGWAVRVGGAQEPTTESPATYTPAGVVDPE